MSNTKTKTVSDLYNYKTPEERLQDKQDRINTNYNNQLQGLETSKTTQQQQADITRSQLQKYLPYYYKSKGLSGLGLEQSAMLEANANYSNQLGKIESDYIQNKNSLENYRNEDLGLAEDEYYTKKDQEIENDSTSARNEIALALENYAIDEDGLTADEETKVNKLINLYGDTMTDRDKNAIENLIENYKVQFSKKNIDDTTQTLTDGMLEGNDYVNVNGKHYKIKRKLGKPVVYDKQVEKFLGDEYGVQAEMKKRGYASSFDSSIPNGTTYEIAGMPFLYYDGKWYLTEQLN